MNRIVGSCERVYQSLVRMKIRAKLVGFTALVLPGLLGCGDSSRAVVAGTVVRHDGSPVTGARVLARSAETGTSVSGYTDANGRFQLGVEAGEGVPPGEYGVVIMEDQGPMDNPRPATFPGKYRNPSTSGLSFSVEAGERQVFDVTLDPL